MANPTQGDVHVNRPLTNISIAYMQEAGGFVADRVFPNIAVQKQSDRYWRYDRSDFRRDEFAKRAAGTESAGGGWKVDNTPTYFCDVWALHKDIDDQVRSNVDDPLNMDRDATLYLSQKAMIRREIHWASKFFTTSVWTGVDGTVGDVTGVAASPGTGNTLHWNDDASNPISFMKAKADQIHLLTGYRPNKFVMGRQVWTALSEHPDLVDRIKYTSGNSNPAYVTREAVAALFEVSELLIMDGIKDTSIENPTFETAMSPAYIAGKNALLCYAAPAASLMQPSAGYTFSWVGFTGAGGMGQRVKRFRMEHLEADRVEAQMAFDMKVVASDCGIFLSGIVA
jgi:hypothetical protein